MILLDNHSNILKIGLSSDNYFGSKPIYKIPSLLGFSFDEYNDEVLDFKLGNLKENIKRDEITQFRSLLELTNPTKQRYYINEEDIINLLDNLLVNKLHLLNDELSTKKLLLTEENENSNSNKMKIGEILFEKIGLGFFNIECQSTMALYILGKETGVVLDIGDEITRICPVSSSYLLKHQIKKIDFGGNDIIDYLIRKLQMKGYDLHPISDFLIGRELKNKYCFVSCDISSDRKLYEETTYYNSFHTLPDGRTIMISKEKFEAPEILFSDYKIHEMLNNAIKVRFFFNNIIYIELLY